MGEYKYRITLADSRSSGWLDWHSNPASSVISGIKIGNNRTIKRTDAIPLPVSDETMVWVDSGQPIRPPDRIIDAEAEKVSEVW